MADDASDSDDTSLSLSPRTLTAARISERPSFGR